MAEAARPAEHAYELLVRKRKEPSPSLGTRAPHIHPELISASQGLKDKEVEQWRKLCERRAG